MMKSVFLRLLIIVGIILILFSSFKKRSENQCELKSNGLNNIQIGKSVLEDVVKEFPSTHIKRKWRKPIEVELIGHFEYFVYYLSLDARFETSYPENRRRKIVQRIILNKYCPCKSASGIGVGSSYKDTQQAYGVPDHKYVYGKNSMEFETYCLYGKMNIIFDGKDPNNDSKVIRIELN